MAFVTIENVYRLITHMTLREYCEELKTKAHGLHFRLEELVKASRPLVEAMPPGEQRSRAAFALINAESALKEHDPSVGGPR